MKKKILYSLSALLIVVSIIFGINTYSDYKKQEDKIKAYAALIPLIGITDQDSFHQKADKVRAFVFEHTQFDMGQEFKKIWGDHKTIAKKISAHAQGKNNNRVPLECSSRSGVFENIMTALGFHVRSVSVFRHDDHFGGHSFSEVMNPDTKQWEAYDPQYHVFWRIKENHTRIGIKELVQLPYKDYEPCRNEEFCGWDIPNRENRKMIGIQTQLGMATVNDYNQDTRYLFVNLERFPMEMPQNIKGKKMTFCEYYPKYCRENVMIYKKNDKNT